MVLHIVNTVLCLIIVIFGFLAYKKNQKMLALFVGIAFGIFGLSHIVTMLGLEKSLMNILIAFRSVAYLLVIFALAIAMKEK
jgi:uncharacterized membrane protein (UPF0136 family)